MVQYFSRLGVDRTRFVLNVLQQQFGVVGGVKRPQVVGVLAKWSESDYCARNLLRIINEQQPLTRSMIQVQGGKTRKSWPRPGLNCSADQKGVGAFYKMSTKVLLEWSALPCLVGPGQANLFEQVQCCAKQLKINVNQPPSRGGPVQCSERTECVVQNKPVDRTKWDRLAWF